MKDWPSLRMYSFCSLEDNPTRMSLKTKASSLRKFSRMFTRLPTISLMTEPRLSNQQRVFASTYLNLFPIFTRLLGGLVSWKLFSVRMSLTITWNSRLVIWRSSPHFVKARIQVSSNTYTSFKSSKDFSISKKTFLYGSVRSVALINLCVHTSTLHACSKKQSTNF